MAQYVAEWAEKILRAALRVSLTRGPSAPAALWPWSNCHAGSPAVGNARSGFAPRAAEALRLTVWDLSAEWAAPRLWWARHGPPRPRIAVDTGAG